VNIEVTDEYLAHASLRSLRAKCDLLIEHAKNASSAADKVGDEIVRRLCLGIDLPSNREPDKNVMAGHKGLSAREHVRGWKL